MSYFNKKYSDITKIVENDLSKMTEYFMEYFADKSKSNAIVKIIREFIENKGKQIRPVLIFLTSRALTNQTPENSIKIAALTEIIHNATLIHDDIIDCSELRRGKKTLNFEYDSKLAVLAGDYLLSEAMLIINSIKNEKIKEIYTKTLSKLIEGEISQYFNRYKIITIEDYIEKSKNKTARLFEAGIVSAYIYNNPDDANLSSIKDFALNFGIGFQIVNDLKNIKNEEKISEDLQNGDYNAPVIFYSQENEENAKNLLQSSPNDILKKINASSAIKKTEMLADSYFSKAIENISFIEDNLYKKSLIDLCEMYKNR